MLGQVKKILLIGVFVTATTLHRVQAMEANKRGKELLLRAKNGTKWDGFEHPKTCGAEEAVTTIKPDVTKKTWLGCSPLSWVLINSDFPFETVKLLVENGADVDEQIDVEGALYAPAEYVRKFGQKEEFPDYPTLEMADYLDAASLKKKLDIGIKNNISGTELQVIAHNIKKFDKAFCRSFVALVYFQNNFGKIPQELWYRFDPANLQTGAKETEKKSSKIIKTDLAIHFYKCPCLLCRERKAQLLASLIPTRKNALVPYNQAAVAGLKK